MLKLDMDTYFANKGISLRYNTLGNTEQLVRSYVKQFENDVNRSGRKRSEDIKFNCYSKLYDMTPRPKYTGFEGFTNIEKLFKNSVNKHITKPQYSSAGFCLDVKENSHTNIPYKYALIDSLKTAIDPVLYMSGGVDSELVAHALLEANVKFTTVIFEWTDKHGNIKNSHDLKYAYQFCKNHGLVPEIVQLDIETLWSTDYFKKLSIDLQISSPQLTTHAYMIEMMSAKYRHSTHLFGGEVRFRSNYLMDNGDYANLVFLNKVSPVGYNTKLYATSTEGAPAFTGLSYYGNDGTWAINTSDPGALTGTPTSGQFTTTPAFQYQFSITSVGVVVNSATGDVINSFGPGIPTAYSNIPSIGVSLCEVNSYGTSGSGLITVQYSIDVRSTTEPGIVVSSSIGLQASFSASF